MCRRLPSERTTGGTPARPPVSRRRIGSPLAAVPVHPAPARLGGSSRALAVLAASWTGRASCYPARGLSPCDLVPVNPARPIRANGFQPMRAAHAARPIHDLMPETGDDHKRRIPHA